MTDPTYNREEIKENSTWNISFIISECINDGAPIGWSKYIWIAEQILQSSNGQLEKLKQDKERLLKIIHNQKSKLKNNKKDKI